MNEFWIALILLYFFTCGNTLNDGIVFYKIPNPKILPNFFVDWFKDLFHFSKSLWIPALFFSGWCARGYWDFENHFLAFIALFLMFLFRWPLHEWLLNYYKKLKSKRNN